MIHGYLEMATPYEVRGWAFDENAPTVRLTVRAHLGNAELGQAEASASRPDLRGKWNENDGNHGFIIEIAPPVSVQRVVEITVHVAHPGTAQWHSLPRFRNETVIRDSLRLTRIASSTVTFGGMGADPPPRFGRTIPAAPIASATTAFRYL